MGKSHVPTKHDQRRVFLYQRAAAAHISNRSKCHPRTGVHVSWGQHLHGLLRSFILTPDLIIRLRLPLIGFTEAVLFGLLGFCNSQTSSSFTLIFVNGPNRGPDFLLARLLDPATIRACACCPGHLLLPGFLFPPPFLVNRKFLASRFRPRLPFARVLRGCTPPPASGVITRGDVEM